MGGSWGGRGDVQNNLKILGSTCVSRPRSSARPRSFAAAVFKARKLGMGCLGANFWSRDILEFCWKPYGFFWVLIFTSFDHPRHLKSGIPSFPLGLDMRDVSNKVLLKGTFHVSQVSLLLARLPTRSLHLHRSYFSHF